MSALESLDTRGLLCPLPVIRTQDRVRGLRPGTLLEVVASDAGTLHDIPAWCRVHGHELLSAETEEPVEDNARQTHSGGGRVYRFRIQVQGD